MNETLLISILAASITAGTPILFAALGELISERAGVTNLGVDGMMLVCARLRHVAGTQWGNKKYMNMKHLEAVLDDTSIAG